MINLNVYKELSTSFLFEVVDSKNNIKDGKPPFYKERIKLLLPILTKYYLLYDTAFSDNTLHTLSKTKTFTEIEKGDLMKLYRYGSKPFVRLKNDLISLPNDYEISTCQYCTINDINTLDHIAPKEDFPEFVVHPKNLIPVCSQCNSHKSSKWLNKGEFEFLNLYLHILPLEQFLFVDVKYLNSTFEVNFFLKNNGNIKSDLFRIIDNHYRNLFLLERFGKKSNSIISQFENSILGNLTKLNLTDALECAKVTIDLERKKLGFNHYENILKLELCEGIAFKQYCNFKGYK